MGYIFLLNWLVLPKPDLVQVVFRTNVRLLLRIQAFLNDISENFSAKVWSKMCRKRHLMVNIGVQIVVKIGIISLFLQHTPTLKPLSPCPSRSFY